MKKNIAIVGCGIVGLLISYKFLKLGHKVTIFEKEEHMGLTNCSTTAAGMLSPYCELIHSDKKIFDLGSDSIYRWKKIINELEKKINKVVLSSNQTLIWDTLKEINYNNKVEGFGELFNN